MYINIQWVAPTVYLYIYRSPVGFPYMATSYLFLNSNTTFQSRLELTSKSSA